MFVEIRDARLFVTDEGSGEPPMVFIHAFGSDSHDWSWQLSHFVRSHRVIALDLRGHGRSTAPADGYEVGSLVDDVAAVIHRLGCSPTVAVGHSIGGAIATAMAATFPELVRAVVAIDPGHLLPNSTSAMLAEKLAAYQDPEQDPGTVARATFDAMSHGPTTPPHFVTWHGRRVEGIPSHVLRKTMEGLIGGPAPYALRENSAPLLSQVRCPVLSFYVEPARSAVATEVLTFPGSKVITFEGSGHWLHKERPAEVNHLIETWLGSLPESPST